MFGVELNWVAIGTVTELLQALEKKDPTRLLNTVTASTKGS